MPQFDIYTKTEYDVTYTVEADDAVDAYERFMAGQNIVDVIYDNDVQEILKIEQVDIPANSLLDGPTL